MKDTLNQYRVFPRLFAIFYLYCMAEVIFWAMNLPDLSNAQTALVTSVTVPAAAFFKYYVETG